MAHKEVRWVIFDAEADGLSPTKFYCLSYWDYKNKKKTLTDYDEIRSFFEEYECYIGHNIRRWDLPNLERVCSIRIPDEVVDTLGVAYYLEPGRFKPGLESYGEDFGVPKPKIIDWFNQTLEEYIHRCETDVKINYLLWQDQLRKLSMLYKDPQDLWTFLRYLDFKIKVAALQEESGWRLDVERAKKYYDELDEQRVAKVTELANAMPPVPIVNTYVKPKRSHKADGELSLLGLRWQDRLKSAGLDPDHEGPVEEIVGYDQGNPGSTVQLKNWLFSLGWKPRTIKYLRDKKTGEIREIPQINKEHGGGVCDSVLELVEQEPALAVLDGLSVLEHRIGILKGFLRDVSPEGYLQARIAGLTNTLRFKHTEVVNLPKPEKPFGEYIRGVLVAEDSDHELCGSDMAGLEDRLKQHFLYFYDPDYVESMNTEDFDPHLDIAVLAGLMTQDQADFYKRVSPLLESGAYVSDEDKKGFKIIKGHRSIAKNGNYACQYGAGPPRLMITCNIDEEAARNLHKTYWDRNWAIKKTAEDQVVIKGPAHGFDKNGEPYDMWLLNPISGFYYSLRTQKDRFSTLIQGSASYCFDLWIRYILEEREQITATFHDEGVWMIPKGRREDMTKILRDSIKKVNDTLGLNKELDISIAFGDNYADIH